MVRQDMDAEISARLMRLAGRHPALDRFWVFCARYLIVLFGLAFMWAAWEMRRADLITGNTMLLTTFAALIVNETVSWGIAYLHFRPRPFVANHLTPLVRIAPGMKSFPSDHAVIAFTFATAFVVWDPPITDIGTLVGLGAVGVAMLISAARVVAGVHYPSDVLAGAALGILGTLAITIGTVMTTGLD